MTTTTAPPIPVGVEAAIAETADDWLADHLDNRGNLVALMTVEILNEIQARCVLLPLPTGQRPRLLPRQVELLKLLALPLSYAEIGERLGVTFSAVAQRAKVVYDVLGAYGRSDAVLRGMALGYLAVAETLAPYRAPADAREAV